VDLGDRSRSAAFTGWIVPDFTGFMSCKWEEADALQSMSMMVAANCISNCAGRMDDDEIEESAARITF